MSWYKRANVYHIYPLGLVGAPWVNDGQAAGNRFLEIESWIPHIVDMGCNAVLFGPLFLSRTHGYDTTDYLQVDNRLGTNAEFAALCGALHANGLRVVLDGVFNHCGRDFFAFADVRAHGRASRYCDWFCGLEFGRGSPLGDPFDYQTWNGYYELVKLNLQNAEVRAYLFDAVRYWIDAFGIDGLRLDAADRLDFDFMRELRRVTASQKPDFWLMGEVVHGDYARWANADTLHAVTQYEVYKALYSSHNDSNLFELAHTLDRHYGAERGSNRGVWLYNFVDNHDQNRIASVVNDPAYLRTIYLLLYTIPGIPSLYYGSEWEIEGVKAHDTDAPLRPRLDLAEYERVPCALTAYIQKLAAIHNDSPALQGGAYRQVYLQYARPFVFERSAENETIVVAVNPAPHAATVDLGGYHARAIDLLCGEELTAERLAHLEVPPHGGRILLIILISD